LFRFDIPIVWYFHLIKTCTYELWNAPMVLRLYHVMGALWWWYEHGANWNV